jgi:CRP-like cAMP-binding protein
MTDRPTPQALARVAIFERLSPAALARLAAAGAGRNLTDGESLYEQGAEARDLYAVTRGRLALRVSDGERWITVQGVEAPDVLGWSALREQARWLTTARALGPVEVIAIPLASILDVIEGGGPDARRLAQMLFGVGAAHLDAMRQQLQQPSHDAIITGG